jgi:hypothetical protein
MKNNICKIRNIEFNLMPKNQKTSIKLSCERNVSAKKKNSQTTRHLDKTVTAQVKTSYNIVRSSSSASGGTSYFVLNSDLVNLITCFLSLEESYYFLITCKTIFSFKPLIYRFNDVSGKSMKLWQAQASREIYDFRRCYQRSECGMYIRDENNEKSLFPVINAIKKIITEHSQEKMVIVSHQPELWIKLLDICFCGKAPLKFFPDIAEEENMIAKSGKKKSGHAKSGTRMVDEDALSNITIYDDAKFNGQICPFYDFGITDCGYSFHKIKALILTNNKFKVNFSYFKPDTQVKYTETNLVLNGNVYQYVLELSKKKKLLFDGGDSIDYVNEMVENWDEAKRDLSFETLKDNYSRQLAEFITIFCKKKKKSQILEELKYIQHLSYSDNKFFKEKELLNSRETNQSTFDKLSCESNAFAELYTIVIDGYSVASREPKYYGYCDEGYTNYLKFTTNKTIEFIYINESEDILQEITKNKLPTIAKNLLLAFTEIDIDQLSMFDSWVLQEYVSTKDWHLHPSAFSKEQQLAYMKYASFDTKEKPCKKTNTNKVPDFSLNFVHVPKNIAEKLKNNIKLKHYESSEISDTEESTQEEPKTKISLKK